MPYWQHSIYNRGESQSEECLVRAPSLQQQNVMQTLHFALPNEVMYVYTLLT